MVQKESYLIVADNSGAKLVQVIHIEGSTRKKFAGLGDTVKCAVKKAIPGGTVKKSEVHKGVIVRTCKETRREDGSYIRFGDNAVVLLNKENQPIGTRIFGPVAREVRSFGKIPSLAPEVL